MYIMGCDMEIETMIILITSIFIITYVTYLMEYDKQIMFDYSQQSL